MTRADLHTHTTASDGQLTAVELVALAKQVGLSALGITDHDTTGGIVAARQAAGETLRIIPGVELSAEDASGDVHMLGYFLDIENPGFQRELEQFRVRRYFRAQVMVEKLAALGMPLAWAQVEAFANGGAIGRPHIARALHEAGYVSSVKEAFDRYIANDGPAYVARKRLSPEEAIELIHSAGGAAVLAHPVFLADYRAMVLRLLPAGLDGLEVVYPKHAPKLEGELRALARRYNLVMTGGSDFHGLNFPGKAMLGSVEPPAEAIEGLQARASQYAV